MMVVMVAMHRKYAEKEASLWRFRIYERRHENRVAVLVVEFLILNMILKNSHIFSINYFAMYLPGTRAIGISPRSIAVILFSI